LQTRPSSQNDARGQRRKRRARRNCLLASRRALERHGKRNLTRPELRYEHSYDNPAYAGGAKKDQLIFAADVILKY
jgi:hypothetical protein